MDKEQLNEARTNPDFIKYLEETRVKSMEVLLYFLLYIILL